MDIPVPVAGFEQHQVVLRSAGLKGAHILLDGKPVPRTKGLFQLQSSGGTTAELRLKGFFLDPVPNVLVNGQLVQVRPDLTPVQWAFVALPLVLIALGGAIGGAFGAAAAFGSANAFRSKLSIGVQYAVAAGCAVAGFLGWSLVVTLLTLARGG